MKRFLIGMGSVLQILPATGNTELPPALRRYAQFPKTVQEAFARDQQAMVGDLRKLGGDMRSAISQIEHDQQ